MRRGFTILELLVAALLLGMLVTVLTMVFNQSSISWRTGIAGLMDMDEVRDKVAVVRDEADCLYVWNGKLYRTVSIWNERSGESAKPLKNRAIDVDDISSQLLECERMRDGSLARGSNAGELKKAELDISNIGQEDVGASDLQGSSENWIVNVQSSGPNRNYGDYDDIKSNPYDFH